MGKDKTKFDVFLNRAKILIILLCLLLSFFLMFCGVQNNNIFLGLFSMVISWQTGVLSFIYITEDKRCSSVNEISSRESKSSALTEEEELPFIEMFKE